jgi:hypothetical protein
MKISEDSTRKIFRIEETSVSIVSTVEDRQTEPQPLTPAPRWVRLPAIEDLARDWWLSLCTCRDKLVERTSKRMSPLQVGRVEASHRTFTFYWQIVARRSPIERMLTPVFLPFSKSFLFSLSGDDEKGFDVLVFFARYRL